MAEVKENGKRTRKPRRNFEKDLNELRLYCQVSVEVLRSSNVAGPSIDGQVDAFERVLAKMDGAKS